MEEFIDIFTHRREKIVDLLSGNYHYSYLLEIFEKMDVDTDRKHVYRCLNEINWVPSQELVHGLVNLALCFKIDHMEEVYAGSGILSALIKKEATNMTITTSEPFENPKTCSQIGFVSIARRAPSDFKYYKQFNEPYPQMIISSYYPDSSHESAYNHSFLKEISDLIQSKNHKIIIIILPHFYSMIYDIFYHLLLENEYSLFTYHTKAVDKYFFLFHLMKELYETGTLIHVLIKNELLISNQKSIESIMGSSIVPVKMIDKHCSSIKFFRMFYDKFPTKLVVSIYKNYDFKKLIRHNEKFYQVINNLLYLDDIKVKIPCYIFEINEFLFWSDLIQRKLYFVHENRIQFYAFYVQARIIGSEPNYIPGLSRQGLSPASGRSPEQGFPSWINTLNSSYIYIYLDSIEMQGGWKNNSSTFFQTWEEVSKQNFKKLRNFTQ